MRAQKIGPEVMFHSHINRVLRGRGIPRYLGIPRYRRIPNIREYIPRYWGTTVYGNAFLYTGVPQPMGMHSHILGYPSTWECIPEQKTKTQINTINENINKY